MRFISCMRVYSKASGEDTNVAVDNEKKYTKAQYSILSCLKKESMRFNELEESAGVSSRTLTKHLRILVPRNVEKVGKAYGITNEGERLLTSLRNLLKGSEKGSSRGYPIDRLDVYMIGREYHCHGVLTGFSRRKLELEQRAAIDKSITQFIKNVRQSIPMGSNWKVSIIWQNKLHLG